MATQIVLGTQEYPRVAEVNQMVKMTKFMTNIDEEADKWQKWSKKWNSGRRDEEPKQGGGQMADKWQTWCEKWNSGRRDEQPKQGGGQMTERAESRKDIKEVNKKIISNTGFSVKSSNNRCLETLELNEVNNMIKSYLA